MFHFMAVNSHSGAHKSAYQKKPPLTETISLHWVLSGQLRTQTFYFYRNGYGQGVCDKLIEFLDDCVHISEGTCSCDIRIRIRIV